MFTTLRISNALMRSMRDTAAALVLRLRNHCGRCIGDGILPITRATTPTTTSIRRCGDFQTGGSGFDIHAYIVYERSIKREWLKRLHSFHKFMQRKSAPAIAEVQGVPLIPFNHDEAFQDEDELEDLMYRSGFKQFMVDPFEYLNNLEKACEKLKLHDDGGSATKATTSGLLVDDELKNQMTEAIQRYLSSAENKKTTDE